MDKRSSTTQQAARSKSANMRIYVSKYACNMLYLCDFNRILHKNLQPSNSRLAITAAGRVSTRKYHHNCKLRLHAADVAHLQPLFAYCCRAGYVPCCCHCVWHLCARAVVTSCAKAAATSITTTTTTSTQLKRNA